jgi:uncharacterized membrane protein
MVASCIGVTVYALRFFVLTVNDDHFARYLLTLRLHILGGMGALLTGPWQFSPRLRSRALNVHRWIGRGYLLSVLLGSVAGFAMATVSKAGLPAHIGFGALAVVWLFTSVQAYRAILRGRVAEHRRWMVRSFALTLAAVTLRNYLPLLLFGLHWSFDTAYITVAWVSWVPNLIVAEWLLRRVPAVGLPESLRRNQSSLASTSSPAVR